MFCVRFLSPEPRAGSPAELRSSPAGKRPPQSPTRAKHGKASAWVHTAADIFPVRDLRVGPHLHCSSWTEDELVGEHVS